MSTQTGSHGFQGKEGIMNTAPQGPIVAVKNMTVLPAKLCGSMSEGRGLIRRISLPLPD